MSTNSDLTHATASELIKNWEEEKRRKVMKDEEKNPAVPRDETGNIKSSACPVCNAPAGHACWPRRKGDVIPHSYGGSDPRAVPAREDKCLDAGIGDKGSVFSLVRLAGKLYVHVNVSHGYTVFRVVPELEPINVEVNNFLATLALVEEKQ